MSFRSTDCDRVILLQEWKFEVAKTSPLPRSSWKCLQWTWTPVKQERTRKPRLWPENYVGVRISKHWESHRQQLGVLVLQPGSHTIDHDIHLNLRSNAPPLPALVWWRRRGRRRKWITCVTREMVGFEGEKGQVIVASFFFPIVHDLLNKIVQNGTESRKEGGNANFQRNLFWLI